ncbi:hypothetical protein BJP36_36465 [Moorena producens JHB]|uniref:Uncharacterized protein n=1 Tax=Moorena producens (strain JHB) TaxID=1454205 RepID=A0A9Q9STY1_MOOP1|nr:hypothetical protein [Moorena producens]WAN69585.1 hypothetical protein BJP36_36465 [Moorena producens JHB]
MKYRVQAEKPQAEPGERPVTYRPESSNARRVGKILLKNPTIGLWPRYANDYQSVCEPSKTKLEKTTVRRGTPKPGETGKQRT